MKSLGFTIIELIIVIVVIGIIWFTTSIRFSVTANLSAPTTQLADDVRYTQNLAMTRNQRYSIIISANSYTIKNTVSGIIEYSVDLNNDITASNLTITFNTKGMPLDINGNQLSSTAIITLSSGSVSSDINITPVTGQVTP